MSYYLKDILTNNELLITAWFYNPEKRLTFLEFAYNGVGRYGAWIDENGNFEWNGQKFNLKDFCEV